MYIDCYSILTIDFTKTEDDQRFPLLLTEVNFKSTCKDSVHKVAQWQTTEFFFKKKVCSDYYQE